MKCFLGVLMPIINVSKIFEAMENGMKFIRLEIHTVWNSYGLKFIRWCWFEKWPGTFFHVGFIFAFAITDLKAMRMLYIHLYLVMFIPFKWWFYRIHRPGNWEGQHFWFTSCCTMYTNLHDGWLIFNAKMECQPAIHLEHLITNNLLCLLPRSLYTFAHKKREKSNGIHLVTTTVFRLFRLFRSN